MHDYIYPLYVVEVPHQRPARGYWADERPTDEDTHDLSGCYVCEDVSDLVYLTHAIGRDGGQARHQAAKIAALAGEALNELCCYLAAGLPDREDE